MNHFIVALVRGSGDVGAAVAHALYMGGVKVIVHDESAPAHPRRGMSFVDALFTGKAVLDGVVAQHVADMDARLDVAALDDHIPVCSRPLQEVLEHFEPDVLIDARMRKRATIEDQRPLARTVIGLGPGFDTGRNCTVAIETVRGDTLGKVIRNGPTAAYSGEPHPLAGVGRERFIYAPRGGVWHTDHRIGQTVVQGQPVGSIGDLPVQAPLDGALRGLTHDGVEVAARQKILEVDPRLDAVVTGRGERPCAIAQGVLHALHLQADPISQFFAFERSYQPLLDCMPMSMRRKLDLCGLRLHLALWRSLSIEIRRTMLDAACENQADARRLRRLIELVLGETSGAHPQFTQAGSADWPDAGHVPGQVLEVLQASSLPPISPVAWTNLSDLQRFALCKLISKRSSRNLLPALAEFGLA